MKRKLILFFLFIPYLIYGIYSYTQTDPNLVLASNPAYWSFQQLMWQIGYHQRELSAIFYTAILLLLFVAYFLSLRLLKLGEKKTLLILLGISFLLIYPALSHDIFNYMFNAKMVIVYHMNPHLHIALEFPHDLWTRFMHNTNTAAPYGYGWTILSLIPSFIGMQKFTFTLLLFRIFMYLGFFIVVYLQMKIAEVVKGKGLMKNIWLFVLNPLVLIELLGNMHNDVWMIVFAMGAIYSALKYSGSNKKAIYIFLIGIFLGASILIKYATIVLLPVMLALMFAPQIKGAMQRLIERYWADVSALLLFLPLFTDRSQLFHPWYLVWSLSFLPFMKVKQAKMFLIAFSFSSLLRYVPYLFQGDYAGTEMLYEKGITWIGGIFFFLLAMFVSRFVSRNKHAHVRINA